MAHHHEGPSQHCYRCGEYYRDDHECYGKPPDTVEKFVRWHGADAVIGWVTAARVKIRVEEDAVRQEERNRAVARLRSKIEEGKAAEVELAQLLQEK